MNKILSRLKDQLANLWKKGAFYIVLGNFATKFVTFFGSIVLAKHLLSKSDYGLLGYIENLYSFPAVFAGLGLSLSLLRYSILSDEMGKKYAYYKFAVKWSFIFNIILVIIMHIFNVFYKRSGFENANSLLFILILGLPFYQLTNDSLMNERALFNNKNYAGFSFISATLIVLGKVIGAYSAEITGVILSVLFVNIFTGIFLFLFEKRKYFTNVDVIPLTRDEKGIAVKYGVQYMITNSLWAMFMLVDVFMIGRILQDKLKLADYKVAYVFPGNIAIISAAIAIFVTPYFVKNENDNAWVKRNYKKIFSVNALLIGVIALILYALTPIIIKVCYGSQYMNVVSLMRLLLIPCFINCGLRVITANALSAMGEVRYNLGISFVGFILEIILDLLLIPACGLTGVVIAASITYSIMTILLFIIFNKKYKII